jgi:hypothetical protein
MLTIHSNQDSIRDVWRGLRLTLSVAVRRAAFCVWICHVDPGLLEEVVEIGAS